MQHARRSRPRIAGLSAAPLSLRRRARRRCTPVPARDQARRSSTRRPAIAPELTNTGIWHAPPILISGTTAYRNGEFLYQDYLYDDHGAREVLDPTDPRASGDTFSKPNGTYTYPTGPGYNNDAADLVEFRVKPTTTATAFRITLEHARESVADRVLDRDRRPARADLSRSRTAPTWSRRRACS